MMSEGRILREKAFHDFRFGSVNEPRIKARKYYSVTRSAKEHYRDLVASGCRGRKLLEYGCGMGSLSGEWLSMGAVLTGIDISEEAIRKANLLTAKTGFTADYRVMNAERTDFADHTFDFVVGTGILHHLDLNNSYAEIARILAKEGRAVFLEPLGHNPLINLYRRLTPTMRTPDERPLTVRDIRLAGDYFLDVDARYYCLFSILAAPFAKTFLFKPLLSLLDLADRSVMLLFPFIRRYSWIVVLDMRHPKR